MAAQVGSGKDVVTVVLLRLLAVLMTGFILHSHSQSIGVLTYIVLGILFLSNVILFLPVGGFKFDTARRNLHFLDGILLPVSVMGAGSIPAEVQIVFIISILFSMGAGWGLAPAFSLTSVIMVETYASSAGWTGFAAGSAKYVTHLLAFLGVAVFGAYISTWSRRKEREIGQMQDLLTQKESIIGGAAKTISYWMNIYETAARGVPSGVVLYDSGMRVVFVNDAFSRLIGEEPSKMLSQTPSHYLPEKLLGELGIRKKLQNILNTGEIIEPEEMVFSSNTGEEKEVIFRALPIQDESGRVEFVIAVFDDLSEIRHVHRQLMDSEQQYRSLFMNIPDSVVVFSLGDGAVLVHNQQFEDLTGCSAKELKDMNFSDFFPEGNLQTVVRKFIYQLGKTEDLSAPIEIDMIMPNGNVLDAEVVFEPYFVGGEVLGVQAIIRDITARKTAETELVRQKVQARLAIKKMLEEKRVAEELRKLDTLKTEFVSMASHELRTPMASIKGALSLLADDIKDKSQQKWLDMALKNVDRLTLLLNDTLDVAKIEAGRFRLRMMDVDLSSLVEQICKEYSIKAKETGHQLIYEEGDAHVRVYADAEATRRVLINLIGNALFHTPSGSRIEVRVFNCDEEKMGCVSVKDNGPGIPKEDIDRIFIKFYQVDRKVGEGSKGTGLGLPICKGLVEQMKGSLRVESEIDKSSTFTVCIPKNKPIEKNNLRD